MSQDRAEVEPVLKKLLDAAVRRAQHDQAILAVVLFGSTARDDRQKGSDLDLCLVLQPDANLPSVVTDKRLEYLAAFPVDVQIFQALPLYIRQRILRDGQVLFCRDEDALYALAFRTIQAFTDFKPLYHRYLREVAGAGS